MLSREKVLAEQFGTTSPSDVVFKPASEHLDLAIPGFAFLRYPPSDRHPFWLYVTHGLSQPMEANDLEASGGLSGFGVEFALATSAEESWPLRMLESVTSYTLTAEKLILPLHRIPAGDLMEEAPGGHLLAVEDPGYKTQFHSISGTFHIVHLVGVTASEIHKAKSHAGTVGSAILECALRKFGLVCVTDRQRLSIVGRTGFDAIWVDCETAISSRMKAAEDS